MLVLGAGAAAAFLARIGPRLVLLDRRRRARAGDPARPGGLRGGRRPASYIEYLSQFGLALLFFFAGLEVVEEHVPRRAIVRGTIGWATSLAVGIAVGYARHGLGLDAAGWLLGIALSTTALGTLVPILSDSGMTPTPLGTAVLGTGVGG